MRNESPDLPYRSPYLPYVNHFEPFYILKILPDCIGSPDFSCSNSFYHFLMHFCTLDSPKNHTLRRVGTFFGGRGGDECECVGSVWLIVRGGEVALIRVTKFSRS